MTTIVTTHGYHGYHITMTTVVLGSEDYFDDLGVTQGINPTRDWPLSCTCFDEVIRSERQPFSCRLHIVRMNS